MTRRYLRGLTLEEKIHAIGWAVDARGCWNWNGRVCEGLHDGYGRIDGADQRPRRVHRVAFELWVRLPGGRVQPVPWLHSQPGGTS